MLIAFDVDGTLVDKDDQPRPEIIVLLKALAGNKRNQIVIWSGGGEGYAAMWGRRLHLDNHVWSYWSKIGSPQPDLAIDDEDVLLGKVNLKV